MIGLSPGRAKRNGVRLYEILYAQSHRGGLLRAGASGSAAQATGSPTSASFAFLISAICAVVNLAVRSMLMMPSHSISVSVSCSEPTPK